MNVEAKETKEQDFIMITGNTNIILGLCGLNQGILTIVLQQSLNTIHKV